MVDPGLQRLLIMAQNLLQQGTRWWNMPFVLILAFTFHNRESLLETALFDSYPCPIPKTKQRCNDPVLGDGYVGCYGGYHLQLYGFKEYPLATVTPEKCVQRCLGIKFPYAALFKGRRCFCGDDYPATARVAGHKCKRRCTGDRRKICGARRHMSLYRTYFCSKSMTEARMIDGSCNDLNNTAAGSRFYRFGRNVNQTKIKHGRLLDPNPRELSRKFLRRRTFKPVSCLNLLAAAWIQFTLHDWFDHGPNEKGNPIKIPLDTDDPLCAKLGGTMKVRRTRSDPCESVPGEPAAWQNTVTHWWDGSQIYGSDKDTEFRLRAFLDGKLRLDGRGFLPLHNKTQIPITGFSNNWWSGLTILHNTFTREHNSICDMLKRNNPSWSDQKLYDTARLINSALMAKIHTVEWTPAILNERFVQDAVNIEWFGILSAEAIEWLIKNGIAIDPDVIKPHIGEPANNHGVPFSLTEEFVAVYRMHSLLPDQIKIWDIETKKQTSRAYDLPAFSFSNAQNMFSENHLDDVLYTFGVEKAGDLVLRNYPAHLTDLQLPRHQGGGIVDVGTIDILRDRERGVPRYNEFRESLLLKRRPSFDNLTSDPGLAAQLKRVYGNDIDKVDLLIGCLAEERPPGFGFGETAFQLFLLMANRRLMTDRFLTDDYTDEYYTKEGMAWVTRSTFKDVLLRNFPNQPTLQDAMKDVTNAFFVW